MNFISSANFTLDPAATFPINIDPGKMATVNMIYTPSAVADDSALLEIVSNDAASPYSLSATGRGVAPGKARLATNPIGKTSFGAASADRSIAVQLYNVGTKDLTISAISQTGSSDFSLDPAPTYLLTIAAGAESDLNIKYHPTSNGAATATFNITASDSVTPHAFEVSGTGVNISSAGWKILEYVGIGLLAAAVLGLGAFGVYEALNQPKKK